MRDIRILFTGGGSGGHLYPLLATAEAVAKKLLKEGSPFEFHYLGPPTEHEEAFQKAGIRMHAIGAPKIRRYASGMFRNLLDIPKFFGSIFRALAKLYVLMPDAVFSKGGPGAFPVVFAAWFYRIPVLVHDSDAIPGLTNLLSGRFARRVAVSFESAMRYFPKRKVLLTGNPVRVELLEGKMTPAQAKEAMGFRPDVSLVLILGGSQGSERVNEFVVLNLPDILGVSQVLHQTGTANFRNIQKLSQAAMLGTSVGAEAAAGYKAVPYFEDDMAAALSAADAVVARAGSGTIFEAAAFSKPMILIPLEESANDHQRANAYEFANAGGGVVIEEANLQPAILLSELRKILSDPGVHAKMSAASADFFRPKASEDLADALLGFISRK